MYMEKDVDKNVKDIDNTSVAPTKRQAYLDYMRSQMGEDFNPDDESLFEEMLDYRTQSDNSKKKIAEMLNENPQLAQIISDMANGKRGVASAFARYFGRDLLDAEEGSKEWEEIQIAEKERQAELEDMRKRKDDYDTNIQSSLPVLEKFAKEKNINIDDFLDETYTKILEPIFSGLYTEDVLLALYNALNYNEDVEDSFRSGVVAGRNQKIDKMRKEKFGDGLPRLGASGGNNGNNSKPKKTLRYKSSVWEDD